LARRFQSAAELSPELTGRQGSEKRLGIVAGAVRRGTPPVSHRLVPVEIQLSELFQFAALPQL
jgi:hypothetical protein